LFKLRQVLFLSLLEEQAHDLVVHLQRRVGERGRQIEQIGHQRRIAVQWLKAFQELRRILLAFMCEPTQTVRMDPACEQRIQSKCANVSQALDHL
jgi:hypothetical protein